jgi:hypothetical protein
MTGYQLIETLHLQWKEVEVRRRGINLGRSACHEAVEAEAGECTG